MRLYFTILMLFFSFVLYSQEKKLVLDSLLQNQIKELKEDDHGIFFSKDFNPLKDFMYVQKLIKKQPTFMVSKRVDGNSTILVFKAKNSKLKIVQIKTIAYTYVNKTKVERYNYLIKDGATHSTLEFDENGLRTYQIHKKEHSAIRESIIIFTDGYDESKFIEDIENAKMKYLK